MSGLYLHFFPFPINKLYAAIIIDKLLNPHGKRTAQVMFLMRYDNPTRAQSSFDRRCRPIIKLLVRSIMEKPAG